MLYHKTETIGVAIGSVSCYEWFPHQLQSLKCQYFSFGRALVLCHKSSRSLAEWKGDLVVQIRTTARSIPSGAQEISEVPVFALFPLYIYRQNMFMFFWLNFLPTFWMIEVRDLHMSSLWQFDTDFKTEDSATWLNSRIYDFVECCVTVWLLQKYQFWITDADSVIFTAYQCVSPRSAVSWRMLSCTF